jgi:hypothetical protein
MGPEDLEKGGVGKASLIYVSLPYFLRGLIIFVVQVHTAGWMALRSGFLSFGVGTGRFLVYRAYIELIIKIFFTSTHILFAYL